MWVLVGYTTEDVVYRWNANRQVAIAEDMKLSQFDLIANPSANHTDRIPHPHAYAISKNDKLGSSFYLHLNFRGVFYATGELSSSTTHGKFSYPSLRPLHSSCSPFVGLVLAQS